MNWFEAFQHVNAEIMATNDDELIDAWSVFLRSPFPHLANPPAADGVPEGRVRNFAEKFLETAGTWRGKGVELLLFRLVQACEAIVAAMGGERPLPAPPVDAAAYDDCIVAGPWVFPVDEAHQVSYCDGCGTPLHPNGGCLKCDGGNNGTS